MEYTAEIIDSQYYFISKRSLLGYDEGFVILFMF